ncbi:DUF3089 domain-containing protein [Sphingomonas sp. ASV193]|uniref:DUF3089 domain-containing protein n=1 Tax=Sphingomonas sp. ASV193 TaxID=3144405 RepID=UPI0032E8E904
MTRFLLPIAASVGALAALPAALSAQPVDYSKASSWICRPGRADTCSTPQPTAALNPNDYGPVRLSAVAKADTGIDCFIVYPTVSNDPGMNSDLAPSKYEEIASVEAQFARFSGVCRTYVPLYRQMTTNAVAAAAIGLDVTEPALLALGDVRAAFRYYLDHDNHGRPFVLIGHSQGSLMLDRLMAADIDGKPVQKQLRLAIVPGFNVMVPQGRLVGGTFRSIPLCGRPGETGCILTWTSYRERNVPPEGALFGIADKPGMTVGCTNPARPGSTEWEPLDSIFDTSWRYPVPGGPISWSSAGAPPAEYLSVSGLLSARCVNDGPRGYLSVRTNADPNDKRTDRVGGEVGVMGFFLPGWGMHLIDVNAALGNLVETVGALSPARSRTGPPAQR